MTYAQYLRTLRAGWWLVLLGVLIGGTAAAGVTAMSTPLYRVTSQVFVSTGAASDLATAVQGGQLSQQRVASYAQMLQSKGLATAVVERLRLPTTPDELRTRIDAVPS